MTVESSEHGDLRECSVECKSPLMCARPPRAYRPVGRGRRGSRQTDHPEDVGTAWRRKAQADEMRCSPESNEAPQNQKSRACCRALSTLCREKLVGSLTRPRPRPPLLLEGLAGRGAGPWRARLDLLDRLGSVTALDGCDLAREPVRAQPHKAGARSRTAPAATPSEEVAQRPSAIATMSAELSWPRIPGPARPHGRLTRARPLRVSSARRTSGGSASLRMPTEAIFAVGPVVSSCP